MKTITRVPSSGHSRRCYLLAVAWMLSGPALAADVNFIGVVKGQTFKQSGADLVALKNPMLPGDPKCLGFETFVNGSAADSLVSGTVALPAGGGTVALMRDAEDPSRLAHEYGEEEYLALNTARPNGVHTVQVVTSNEGTLSVGLNLTGDSYPPVPRVTNHTALQSINPSLATTLQWPAWAGGGGNDFMMLSVWDDNGSQVFSTPEPGTVGALTGTSVSATLPASTLQASHTYEVELMFLKVVDFRMSPVLAIAGYYKRTEFSISTVTQAGSALGAQFDFAVPGNGNGDVSRDSKVLFRFTRPMDPAYRAVTWTGSGLDPSKFSYGWLDSNRTLLCRYTGNLPGGTAIGWNLNLAGFKDAAGVALQGGASGGFSTTTVLPGTTPAVTGYYLFKMCGYRQTGTSPVATNMFGCDPSLELGGYNRIIQATLIPSVSGGSLRLEPSEWDPTLELEATYASKSDLDLYFPNGTFTFNATAVNATVQPYTLTTGAADDYPVAPTITNLASLQTINPAAPVTISWTSLAGWTNVPAEGFKVAELEIENDSGFTTYRVDPQSMSSASGHTIPAGTLWPGRTYRASVTFLKIIDLDDITNPGAFGVAGFSSITGFTIHTTGTTVMPSVVLGRAGSSVSLDFSGGEPERAYVVESSTDCVRWLPQDGFWLGGGGQTAQYFDHDAPFLPKRFYRLRDQKADEAVMRHVDLQGVVWMDSAHNTPVAGATVGTTLDDRTVTTDAAGRFFLETDTPGNNHPGSQPYSVKITVGTQMKNYGPFTGTHPRSQFYEWSTGGYGVSGP